MNKRIIDLYYMSEEMTKRLNEIAIGARKDYSEFVDRLSEKYGKEYYWWCTSFACRNINLDRSFMHYCRMLLFKEILSINLDAEHIEIHVPSKALMKCMQKYICENKLEDRVTVIDTFEGQKNDNHKWIKRFMHQIKRIIIRYNAVHRYGHKKKFEGSRISLIWSGCLSSQFKTGKYIERDLNGIQDYTERDLIFLMELGKNDEMSWKDFVTSCEKEEEYRMIFPEHYNSVVDFIDVFRYVNFCLKVASCNYRWKGIDLTDIVTDSMYRSIYNECSLRANQMYHSVVRMKRQGIDIESIVFWHESRPIDVVTELAFRKEFPNAIQTGYVACMPSRIDIGLYPTKIQKSMCAAPKTLAFPMEEFINELRQFSDQKAVVVPILRARYDLVKPTYPSDNNIILVVLSYFVSISVSMLRIVNNFMKHTSSEVKIVLKNHPVNASMTLEQYQNILNEKIVFETEFASGTLDQALEGKTVAFMAQSSSGMEIIAKNVYLIRYVTSDYLDKVHIPSSIPNDCYTSIYNENEFSDAMEYALSKKREKPIDMKKYIEVVSSQAMERLWTGSR